MRISARSGPDRVDWDSVGISVPPAIKDGQDQARDGQDAVKVGVVDAGPDGRRRRAGTNDRSDVDGDDVDTEDNFFHSNVRRTVAATTPSVAPDLTAIRRTPDLQR